MNMLTTKCSKLVGGKSSLSYSSPSVDVSTKVTFTTELFLWVSVVSTAVFLPLVGIAGGGNDCSKSMSNEMKLTNKEKLLPQVCDH